MTRSVSKSLKFLTVAWLPVFTALLPAFLAAQSQSVTGTVQGTVIDPAQAAVPNATVIVKNSGTGVQRTVKTDGAGRYQVPLLGVGTYEVAVSAPGFATVTSRGYQLTLGQVLTADVTLQVSSSAQAVTVESTAPVVETSSALTSTLIDSADVASLPLNGRRFQDLAQMTPGVMVEPERSQITFAGSRGVNTAINVDGTNFNEPFFGGQAGGERSNNAFQISQSAVDQFQIVRGTFDPEYGGTTGGMMNVITKSGSNQFHGEAFDYFRSKSFAPKNLFGDQPATTRDQYGAAIGGPIKKDKLFFFAVYDGQKEWIPLNIHFGGNLAGLPQSYLSQQGAFQSTNDINTFLGKVDWNVSQKHRLSMRYSQSGNTGLNGTFVGNETGTLQNNGTEQDFSHAGVANITSTFSPTLLNELRFQYRVEDRPRVNNGEDMSFTNLAGPQTQITGCCFFGGVSFLPIPVTDTTLQVSDSVSWIHGAHTVKFGIDIHHASENEIFRGNWRGVYIFNTLTNFLNTINGVVTNGVPATADQFRIFYGDGAFSASQPDYAGFIQDSWKASRRLTISGGLRYDASLMPTPPRPNPALPVTAQIPSSTKEFQPRLGIAYDLTGDGKTVLRAGGGFFYAGTPGLLLNQAFNSSGNLNVGVSFTLNAAQIAAVRLVHPEFVYPFVPATGNAADSTYFSNSGVAGLKPNASFFSPDFTNPRSINFTAGIQRQVTSGMSVGFDWVHSSTVHLERIVDINLFPAVVAADSGGQQRPIYNTTTRPNPNYGQLLSQQSSAHARYDGLTLAIQQRMSHRLQFNVNATLAWNKDDDSNERNFSGITYQDAACLACEYTWSRDDIRRRLGGSLVYQLPWGFQVSGLMSWRTGLPFSAFTGSDSNKDGNFTDRPIIGGVPLGRNIFRQPNYWDTDLRVSKNWKIKERQSLEFIADMFNAFNTVNWKYTVSTNESSTTALGSVWGLGQTPNPTFRSFYLPSGALNVGGAYVENPFQLQLSLKYRF